MEETKRKKLLGFAIFTIFIIVSLIMTYKAGLETNFYDPVKDTWSWAHKHNAESKLILDANNNQLEEIFLCTVPDLSRISVYMKKQDTAPDTAVNVSLWYADNDELVSSKSFLSSELETDSFTSLKMKFEEPADSENKLFRLEIAAENLTQGYLLVNANVKYGLVKSFNGNESDRTNIVYDIKYGNAEGIKTLFVLLAVLYLLFTLLVYYFFIIKGYDIEKVFWPIAVLYGIIMLVVVPVNGVPDESWHMDTAYKYSNYIMGIGSTGNEGTIFKRHCDIMLTDMLPNDIETGSYYQMVSGLWTKPENTELQEVSYYDSGNQVTFLNFLPAALGLSFGRLLGFSPVLTFQFARFLNFIAYALLIFIAVKIIPYGKELMAMSALLPILVQQAASFSYDGVLMGMIYLFIAVCIYLMKTENAGIKWYVLCTLLVCYLVLTKGAVYSPIALLLLLIKRPTALSKVKISGKKVVAIVLFAVALVFAVVIIRFMPILGRIIQAGGVSTGPEDSLSLGFILGNPLHILILIWNTIFESGDKLFFGAFGGVLGWNNREVVAFLPVMDFVGLLVLANCMGGKFVTPKVRKVFFAGGILSTGLIVFAMLLAETTYSSTFVDGLQGRYFVPQIFMLIISIISERIDLDRTNAKSAMTMMLTVDAVIMLQVFAGVVG